LWGSPVLPETIWALPCPYLFAPLAEKSKPPDLRVVCAMKQYVIDELRLEDHNRIKKYLDKTFGSAEMGGIYWMPLATEVLSEIQHEHSECQPFYVAIDLEEDRIALELLVRTKSRVRCDCIAYASKDQRNWIMGAVDAIFEKLNIAT
jgi:hypothetical protein